jgi:hypothetical protein
MKSFGFKHVVMGFRIALALGWAAVVTWMFVYAMPLSGLVGLTGVWALWPSFGPPAWWRRGLVLGIAAMVPLCVGLIGFPEYAATTNELHCRTLGFMGNPAPEDCDPAAVARGVRIAKANGPLFSTRERLGVHGFNHLLAVGGLMVFLPEVAVETAAMSWVANPLPPGATLAQRRQQCRVDRGTGGFVAAPVATDSALLMRSAKVRRAIAAALPRLGSKAGSKFDMGEIHFVHGSNDNEAYGRAFLEDSLRVALALEVGDSRIVLHRRADGDVDGVWTGTIQYPDSDTAFGFPWPTVWGWRRVRVSETVFCGMQAEGAMNPFVLTYNWTFSPSDVVD